MKAKQDFNRISPTAWVVAECRAYSDIPYAKEMLQKMKLIATKKDKSLSNMMRIATLSPRMEARYKLTNKCLLETGHTQVLELASGFASRGLVMSEEGFNYVELDLPPMIKQKRKVLHLIKKKLPSNLKLVEGNALKIEDLIKATSNLDRSKGLVVINEGLLRYLTFTQKRTVAKNVLKLLKTFNGGFWITPDVNLKHGERYRHLMPRHPEVSRITGINIDRNLFRNLSHAKKFFTDLGFSVEFNNAMLVAKEISSSKKLKMSNTIRDKMIESMTVAVMKPK